MIFRCSRKKQRKGFDMEYRKFGSYYLVRIDRGEEVMESLTKMCREEGIRLGAVSGLGAADYAKAGIYRVADHQFEGREFFGEQEISSIVGSITEKDGEPYLHLHINLFDENMNIHGGHLTACRISGTCELTVTLLEGHVGRMHDEVTGLNLFEFD